MTGKRLLDRVSESLENDLKIAMPAVFAPAAGLLAYVAVFGDRPLGAPSDWAAFGDYFGGLFNPIIGIVTVLLVVRTLKATREEAELTRRQLQQQIEHGRQDLLLGELRKRLEGAYLEWKGLLELPSAGAVRVVDERLMPDDSKMTAGSFLGDPFTITTANFIQQHELRDRYWRLWRHAYGAHAHLLEELAVYCEQYQEQAGNRIVADYYRRRVSIAATVMESLRVIEPDLMHRLSPASLVNPADCDPVTVQSQVSYSGA